MNPEMLLEAIGEIDLMEVRTARPEKTRKRLGQRLAWAGAAAAAVLAAALILPRFLTLGGVTTERIEDMTTITDSYGGTLLAENLLAAGAELSDIELQHREDRDVTDASGWKSLSFTARRGEEQLEMTCTFGVPENFSLPGLPDETLDYGGVTVWLYITQAEDRADYPYSCRTIFICEGVVYDMELRLRSADDFTTVYAYLEMVLGVEGPDAGSFHPLEDLMGFTDYRVTVDAHPDGVSTWHFWLNLTGVETCVAEAAGPDGELGVYGVDLDGDGRDELVANNRSMTGVETVSVYRYSDGQFYVGWIDESFYDEAGFTDRGENHAVNARYDPEKNVFVVDYTPDGQTVERAVTFSGTEHLLFRRYAATAADHFAEPTDTGETGKPDDTAAPDPAVAIPALKAVLTGEADFQNTREDGQPIERLTLDTVGEVMTPGGAAWFEAREFAVVDMDGDGVKEAILRLYKKTVDEYDESSVVLHYTGGDVNGYLFYARGFRELKVNGVFNGSAGAANQMYYRLEFSGARCLTHVVVGEDSYYDHTFIFAAQSPEDYAAALEAINAMPDAEWYPLTAENIEEQFG